MLKPFLFLTMAVLPAQDAPPAADAVDRSPRQLAAAASTAAYRYERVLWRSAPTTPGPGRSGRCDERVGRFCFWYGTPDDTPAPPPPQEPEEVEDARTVAVRAHRLWFAAEPSNTDAAAGLVRYLIDSGREREAVAAARTHAWAADRSPGSLLLVGLALHQAGDFASAEAAFDSARGAADPELRREWDDVSVLLESGERGRYRDLSQTDRARYHDRFWALSDPFLLESGNERRSAHYARHAWALIHSEAPRVQGKTSWGSDHEEILLRYGLPTGRKRIREFGPGSWSLTHTPNFIENFASGAVSLVPAALLTRGLPEPQPPGTRHDMERDTAPSAYVPVRMNRVRVMEVQASRFPNGSGGVLRIDAILPPDTVEPVAPIAPRGLLAVLDTMGQEVGRAPAVLTAREDDSTVLGAELALEPGAYIYRVEIVDDSTGIAGLGQGRFAIDPGGGLALSDLVIAEAFGDSLPRRRDHGRLEPLPSLVVPGGPELGFYAEVHGLGRQAGAARYEVEWSVESAEEGSLLGRAMRWVGRQLGVVGTDEPMAIRWEDVSSSGIAPVALTMDLSDADPGLYRVALTVTDRLTGTRREAARLLLIEEAPRAGYGRPRD